MRMVLNDSTSYDHVLTVVTLYSKLRGDQICLWVPHSYIYSGICLCERLPASIKGRSCLLMVQYIGIDQTYSPKQIFRRTAH